MIDDFQESNKNEEMNISFVPIDPELALSQIQQTELSTRKIGFDSLIQFTSNGEKNDQTEFLIENNIFQILINSFNEENIPIIGSITASFRGFSSLYPESFDEFVILIPLDFLLSIKPNSDIIDFLSNLVQNSDTFAEILLENEKFLTETLSLWLQSSLKNIIKSTIDLIGFIALYNPNSLDFSIIRPFTDSQFSNDIRSLTLSVFLNVEPSDQLFKELINLIYEDQLSSTLFEVLHDLYSSIPEMFQEFIQDLINISIKNISITSTCILLTDLIQYFNEEQITLIINSYFNLTNSEPEHCYLLFNILNNGNLFLNENEILIIGKQYEETNKLDKMELLEKILALHIEYLKSEDCQLHLINILNKDILQAARVFEFILDNFKNINLIPNLLEIFNLFLNEHNEELIEMSEKINSFISHHK